MYDNGEPKNDIIDMREPEKKETEKPAVKEIPFETAKKDITDERQIPPSKPSAAFDPKPAPPPSLPPPYHPYKPDARYYGRRRYDRRGIVAWLVALGVVFLMINVMGYNEARHVRVISSRAYETPADMSYELPEPVPYAMSSTEYMAGDVPMVADAVFAASDIESIESELVATSVNIYENDGSEIVVKWMSDREIDEQKPQIIFDNGQLILKEKKELFSLDLSALFGRTQSYINIYIPAGSYEDLDLETASGNIKSSAAGLIFDELDLDTVSGYIDLSGVTVAGGAEISATSGSVNIYNSSADKFEITSISGDINVSVIDAGDISLKSTSGYIGLSQVNADDNLEINSVSGYITAKSVLAAEQGVHSTSGDITLSDIAFEKLGISTVSGNTNLSLPNVNTFTLKVSTVSGSIQNNSGKARESAEASIEFSSISGDLYIEN